MLLVTWNVSKYHLPEHLSFFGRLHGLFRPGGCKPTWSKMPSLKLSLLHIGPLHSLRTFKPGTHLTLSKPTITRRNDSQGNLSTTRDCIAYNLHSRMLTTFKIKDSTTMSSQRFMPPQVLVIPLIPRGTEPARSTSSSLLLQPLQSGFWTKHPSHLAISKSWQYPAALSLQFGSFGVSGQILWKGSKQKQAVHNVLTYFHHIVWSVFHIFPLPSRPPVCLQLAPSLKDVLGGYNSSAEKTSAGTHCLWSNRRQEAVHTQQETQFYPQTRASKNNIGLGSGCAVMCLHEYSWLSRDSWWHI